MDINVDISIHSPTLQIITRKNVAFILSERAYKFKTGRCDIFLKKITEFIHFFFSNREVR